jgi:hypothetical protein
MYFTSFHNEVKHSNLLRLDLPRINPDHPAVVRKPVSLAYDSDDDIDINEVLKQLVKDPRSKYYKLTRSRLGGMLLAERLRQELEELHKTEAKGA